MKLSLVAERERERDYSFVPHSLIYYEPHGFSSIKVWIQKKHQSFSTLMLHSADISAIALNSVFPTSHVDLMHKKARQS